MTRTVVLVAAAALMMTIAPCTAQTNSDLAQENAQLRQRVEKLEEQVEELKTAVEPAPPQVKSPAKTPAEQAPPLPATSEPEKKPLWSNLDIQFYGFIKGELFTGQDLNTYFGGIGQGVTLIKSAGGAVIDAEPISASGGWFAFTLGPWDKWSLNAGLGIDDVDSDDVNPGDRTRNRSIFGNALYAINQHATAGLELSHWQTDYRGLGDADDVRLQGSLIYKF